MLCCTTDYDDEFEQDEGIKHCKPGIWTSVKKLTGREHPDFSEEYFLYWVEAGTIDISQSVDDWKAYEDATRPTDEEDTEARLSKFKWKDYHTYYDDGGVCSVISTEYVTEEAARRVQFQDVATQDDHDHDFYMEMIAMKARDSEMGNAGFTIGGLSCMYDGCFSFPL